MNMHSTCQLELSLAKYVNQSKLEILSREIDYNRPLENRVNCNTIAYILVHVDGGVGWEARWIGGPLVIIGLLVSVQVKLKLDFPMGC